jgi:membrane protease YdiL (CAAX protease family)
MQGDKAALIEVSLVFLAVTTLTWLASRADFLPLIRDNLHLLVAALFVFTAIRCAERLPGGLARYGIGLGGVLIPDSEREAPGPLGAAIDLLRALLHAAPSFLRELGVAVLVCGLVFPPFVVAFYFWNAPQRPFELLPHSEFGAFLLTQIVVVGLPEEMLFRGYVQGRLEDIWPRKVRFLFAELSLPALLLQAALFAVLHFVVDVHVPRLAVFFPALLFGWLRSLRRGVGAAVFVHAFCNLLSDMLARGWL